MSDETTLLPCPFCGGEAETHEVTFPYLPYHYWDVWCDGECFDHFCEKATEAGAIAAWNTRAERPCMSEYIVRMPPDMPYEIRAELNAWYIASEPLVRCRDCVYYAEDPEPIDPGWPMMCERTGDIMVEPSGYCAWGTRKKGDE